jgi:stringent starvation protein B
MLPPSQLLPPKKDVLEALLARGTSVFLHLDPRREGVSAPSWLSSQAELVLRLGHNLVPAIPDLVVDDDGVRCTLRFRGTPHLCVLPWAAIYALVGDDGRGVVWPEDVPTESALKASLRPGTGARAEQPERPREPYEAQMPKRRPRKAQRPAQTAAATQAGSGPTEASTPKPKRELPPYLRVVK